MKMLKLLVITTIAVAGCSSFNKIEIRGPVILDLSAHRPELTNDEPPLTPPSLPTELAEPATTDKAVTPPKVVESLAGLCPAYKAPALPKRPELPYEEFKRLANGLDKNALDNVMLDHIEALRRHDALIRRIIFQSQTRYIEDCKRWRRDHRQ